MGWLISGQYSGILGGISAAPSMGIGMGTGMGMGGCSCGCGSVGVLWKYRLGSSGNIIEG